MRLTRLISISILLIAVTLGIIGCAGTAPLNTAYRAGDTVTLAAGWRQTFDRSGLTVTITGSDGVPIVYQPGDPAIRAIINLYPDPLSYLVVGTRTGLNSNYNYGSTYGGLINSQITGYDPDWWQTSVFVDLPSTLPVGTANVTLQSVSGTKYGPIPIQIIAGQGSPSTFSAESLGNLTPVQLQSMERAPKYTVSFSGGSILPGALQIDLTHDPASSIGGVGTPFVVNPRGEMKNISWTDDGTHLRVIILTSGDGTSKDPSLTSYQWKYFKFYVSGGITNLLVTSVKAYDSAGNPISGVTANAL
ncbi:MAG: hypothetical protein ACYDBW_09935 [Sulfuricaulis sp.]